MLQLELRHPRERDHENHLAVDAIGLGLRVTFCVGQCQMLSDPPSVGAVGYLRRISGGQAGELCCSPAVPTAIASEAC